MHFKDYFVENSVFELKDCEKDDLDICFKNGSISLPIFLYFIPMIATVPLLTLRFGSWTFLTLSILYNVAMYLFAKDKFHILKYLISFWNIFVMYRFVEFVFLWKNKDAAVALAICSFIFLVMHTWLCLILSKILAKE